MAASGGAQARPAKRPLCVVVFWPGEPPPESLLTHLTTYYEQVVHMTAVQPTLAMLRGLSTSRSEPFVLASLGTPDQPLLQLVKALRTETLLSAISVIGTSEDAEDVALSPLVLAGMTAFVASPISPVTAKTLWTMVAAAAQPSITASPTLYDRRPSISPLAAAAAAAGSSTNMFPASPALPSHITMPGQDGRAPHLLADRINAQTRTNRSLSVSDRDRPDRDASSVNHLGPVDRSIIKLFTHYAVPLVTVSTPFPTVDLKDKRIRRAVSSWDFHCLSLKDDELMASIFHIFDNFLLFKHFRLPLEPFKRFLLAVRANYLDNPYHNFRHAIDVLQSFQFLLCRGGLHKHLQPLELLSLAIAALCHDLAHPGLNNFFQINARTPLSLLYNNKSVLENLHSSLTFTLLARPDLNFLSAFSSQEFTDLRHMIISAILSTDMALHFDFVKSLKERGKQGFTMGTKDDISLMTSSLIKAADISNVARPFAVAKAWAQVLLQEFTNQSQLEAKLGYPILPYGREDVKLAKSQEEFIKFVALPFFSELEKFSPAFSNITRQILFNVDVWQAINNGKDVTVMLQASEKKHAPLTMMTDIGEDDEDAPSDSYANSPATASAEKCTIHSSDNSSDDIGRRAVANFGDQSPQAPPSPSVGSGQESASSSPSLSPFPSIRQNSLLSGSSQSPSAMVAVLNSSNRANIGSVPSTRKHMHRRVRSDATNDVIALTSLLSGWRAPVAAVTSEMHSVDGGVMTPLVASSKSATTSPNPSVAGTPMAAGVSNNTESLHRNLLARKAIQMNEILAKRRHSMPVLMLP